MSGRVFLGRYETIRLLGEGGMGRVYLARQTDLGRQVVVKVMHDHLSTDPKFRERFQRETLLMARFQHPYVVALYDATLDDPHGPCIVMEHIRGVTLDTLMQSNGRLSPARVGRLLDQMCEALYAAHAEGIVHRDLKPANIMVVDADTPYEKIKVMDFGLAKLMSAGSNMGMYHKPTDTGTDFAVGTPGYISPEQVRGDDVDYRCDLYSLGVILYELLTGKLPFVREETMDVLFAHATEMPPAFAALGADVWVPGPVEDVVMRCLAKTPEERPASARDLALLYQNALMETPDVPAALTPTTSDLDLPAATSEGPALSAAPPPTEPFDPNVIVHQLEAWMPDVIATYKLRGFVHDHHGEVLDSSPGLIRVRLGAEKSTSWFQFRRTPNIVDMELRMERTSPPQDNKLHITVRMSSPDRKSLHSSVWRERCAQIYCELRSHLVASTVS